MKLNDFKSLVVAHQRSFTLKRKKPATDDHTMIHQSATKGDQQEKSEHISLGKQQLPYHSVLQHHILPNAHLLRTASPLH